MKYLTTVVETYRMATVEQVQEFHEELKNDTHFTLASLAYRTKAIKEKGEVIEEYQLVTVKKLFNIEKEPDSEILVEYTRV